MANENVANALSDEPRPATPYSWAVLVLLTLVFTSNFLDRQILSILAEPIKEELNLSDTQVGLLTGLTFALFYTFFGIPVAWIADRFSRVYVVAISCFLWSVFSVACGFAANFWQLALARVGVGIGEAGGSPPSHSLISDYFPPRQRGTALAIYALGVSIGPTLGTMVGGLATAEYGWRAAFFIVGAPGVLLALLVVLFIREPARGRFDAPSTRAQKPPPLSEGIKLFLTTPQMRSAAIACATAAFVGYAMGGWFPAFLLRTKGVAMEELAIYYGLITGLASAAGTFFSGWFSDKLSRKYPGAYGFVPAVAFAIAVPFYVAALYAPDWMWTLALILIPTFASNMFLAPALTVIQNAAPPSRRGVSSALLLFALNLFGLGLGPLYVGAISDLAAPAFGESSLQIALIALVPMYLVTIFAHLGVASAVEKAVRANRS